MFPSFHIRRPTSSPLGPREPKPAHPRPQLSATPAQLHQLHRTYGHWFRVTATQQVRAWLGPGLVDSTPGPELSGLNDLLDECAQEFLRYCPSGGVFAVRWHRLLVVHYPREEAIADFCSPRDSSRNGAAQPAHTHRSVLSTPPATGPALPSHPASSRTVATAVSTGAMR